MQGLADLKTLTSLCVLGLFAATSALSHAAAGHVHGAATLEIGVDGDRLRLDFESPLENLVGFERAPRDDREKAAARRLKESLQKPELLFVPTPGARCVRESATVDAPVLEGAKPGEGGHAALSAGFVFRCERPQALSGLDAKIFDVFPRLTRLDVQVAGAKKQKAARLTPKDRSVSW